MKLSVLLIFLLFSINIYASKPEIQEVRVLFEASAKSKTAAEQFLKLLATTTTSDPPIYRCYQGVSEMMQAKYGFNPIHKLKRFKRGKTLIEEAVSKAPEDVEIRFLRFVIQSNLPVILNYNEHINQDKHFLLVNLKTIKDNKLKQSILKYLADCKNCTPQERKGLIG